ncbi:MAG: glycosyltransferase family 4 protein [Spirochaetales bacterium]|nr:glycosyltransferase family 4 protein [Spirochaetales bacterium]
MGRKIGFISFRISGTDGVSLETMKWATILERQGHTCYFMAGQLDIPDGRSFISPLSHFTNQDIVQLYRECFGFARRPESLTKGLHKYRELLKKDVYEFIKRFDLDLLIPENVVTIPLNIPLGMAITEVIAETGIPTIAHHHDFFWERKRFLRNNVWDYLNSCYPPHLNSIHHVVINSSAQNQLALRTGISSTLVPNVMEFESPPPEIDDYNRDVRKELGIPEDELLLLQPTRVVQRKGIEHAIELTARLGLPATLVISHASGDEGYEYEQRVKEFAELLGTHTLFVDEKIGDQRGTAMDGSKIFSLQDIYPHADLVTYPSIFEGFGNAFLEAIYFKKPILVNNYSIFSHDIKPKGFTVIEMDEFISQTTIDFTRNLLQDPGRIKEMVENNYHLGLKYYSYSTLDTLLNAITSTFWGQPGPRN